MPHPSGGSALNTIHATGAPGARDNAWRSLRSLRHRPPGRAGSGKRQKTFCAALEQAEQLFGAAVAVGYATRPLLLFYGLSQAGRAVTAASIASAGDSWKLNAHGIGVPNLGAAVPAAQLTVVGKGVGSFTSLAPLLGSDSLPDGAPLGQIWATIPDLVGYPLGPASYLPVLQLHPIRDERPRGMPYWVVGLPSRPTGYSKMSEDELLGILQAYPSLVDSRRYGAGKVWVPPTGHDGRTCTLRAWDWSPTRLDQPYRDDRDRWVFPPVGSTGGTLHPLLAWWAILYSLSMLARYEPAKWNSHIDVDTSIEAVALQTALDAALDTCPQLILRAIHTVSAPSPDADDLNTGQPATKDS